MIFDIIIGLVVVIIGILFLFCPKAFRWRYSRIKTEEEFLYEIRRMRPIGYFFLLLGLGFIIAIIVKG